MTHTYLTRLIGILTIERDHTTDARRKRRLDRIIAELCDLALEDIRNTYTP